MSSANMKIRNFVKSTQTLTNFEIQLKSSSQKLLDLTLHLWRNANIWTDKYIWKYFEDKYIKENICNISLACHNVEIWIICNIYSNSSNKMER